MLSNKFLASLLIISVVVCLSSADLEDWDDLDNSKRMSRSDASKFLDTFKRLFGGKDEELREDNDELGERRAEAFEAYEEKCEPVFHVGKRACPLIKSCGAGFEANAFNNYDPKATTAKPAAALNQKPTAKPKNP